MADCAETRLMSESNVLVPPQTIAVIPTKNIFSAKITLEEFATVLLIPFSV